MNYDTEAARIVAQLTPNEIAYAASEERGELRGFAALNDLMDANELLPAWDDSLPCMADHQGYLDVCNAIIDRVSELIINEPLK